MKALYYCWFWSLFNGVSSYGNFENFWVFWHGFLLCFWTNWGHKLKDRVWPMKTMQFRLRKDLFLAWNGFWVAWPTHVKWVTHLTRFEEEDDTVHWWRQQQCSDDVIILLKKKKKKILHISFLFLWAPISFIQVSFVLFYI